MRKLLYSLLPLSVIGTTLEITSCSKGNENDHFKQFEDRINKKESFIYYIAAKNCTDCQKKNTNVWNKLFKDGNLTDEGKKEKAKLDLKHPDLTKSIDLKGYKVEIDDFNDWTNKAGAWAKDLKKWVADKILAFPDLLISGEKDKTLSEANVNFNGTPMFIFIKNGQFAGYSSGAGELNDFMDKIENHLYIEDWFDINEYITATKDPKPESKY